MICPEDTKIAFFGGANNKSALRALRSLSDAEYTLVVGEHDPREAAYIDRKVNVNYIPSRADAIKGCQVILTSCETSADVEDLYLGDNGLLELMEPGQYAIDLSFTTPRLAREIQAMAAVNDLVVLDAPIINIGTKEQTVAFIGGEPSAIDAVAPLFPFLAPNIFPQTKPGEGQFAAVLSVVMFAGSIMSTVEALAMQRIAGFSNKTALDILSHTGTNPGVLFDYAPRIKSHDYSGVISVSAFLNALNVVLDTAEDLDVTLPMIETCYQLYDLLSLVGGDELNVQALALLYEDEKTCAEYGLDWALAEDYIDEACGCDDCCDHDGPDDAPSFNGFFSQN